MKKWLEIVLIYGALGGWWVIKFRWYIIGGALAGFGIFAALS